MKKYKEDELNKYIEMVQNDVAYCVYCQPWDSGHVIWIHGRKTDFLELFYELEIPEDIWNKVLRNVVCPWCGSAGFEIGDHYGAKTEEELAIDARWQKWADEYESSVEDFASHLENYPYLGLLHNIGRLIHETIRSFPSSRIENQIWVRARKPDGSRAFSTKDLLPPDRRYVNSEGRFNHYGQSAFYLAANENAAMAEILDIKNGETVAWLQNFKIADSGTIMDLREITLDNSDENVPIIALGLISKHITERVADPTSAWKPEYLVPRFIADCAKKEGFEGIEFSSRKHYYANLVLFDPKRDDIEPVGEPEIVKLKKGVLP